MWYGVSIFFTISGFLITHILIQQADSSHKLITIKNFIIRRALRLFPIYYLFLGVFILLFYFLNLHLWKPEYGIYLLTYTANFFILQFGNGTLGYFNHLWSLAVEEQFYLFWPWIILFSSKKNYFLIFCIVIVLPFFFHFINLWKFREGFLFPFHTLGVGSLLAYFYYKKNNVFSWLRKNKNLFFITQLSHLILFLIYFEIQSTPTNYMFLYREFALMIFTFSIVNITIWGWPKPFNALTNHSVVQYIGKISYGIYIYHMPIPFLSIFTMHKIGIDANSINQYMLFSINTIVTFLIAYFSYNYIEKPFVNLKSRFK
jgi:peptidoglycan/LPS O-acetylase OafA/YrhL